MFAQALWLIVVVNAVQVLPFACALLAGPLNQSAQRYDRLCLATGLTGFQRARWVDWPLLRRPVGLALGLCAALAAGDLTAVALFGSQDLQTLPLLLYQRVGSYHIAEAAVTALLLLVLCLLLYMSGERLLGGKARARD